MENQSNTNIKEIARSLDCITEQEFCELLKISPLTAVGWRQRSQAPLPILIGNNYFYPLAAIKEEMALRVRTPRRKKAAALA
jgi:hypothetical protein